VHDDLLALEGGIEVRDDADLPARRVRRAARVRNREDLGRSAIFASVVERAAAELLARLRFQVASLGTRTPGPRRGDDDGPSGDRVAPDLGRRQLCDP
jgi:hypothetical protein